jgi:beta-N-acetylhexosaminidase
MSHGPLMFDLEGLEMTPEERDMLLHPAAGGVILFARNYRSPEQVERLVSAIHELRKPELLVAVDQEGGRVQRFQDGFVRLPPAAWFGELYDKNSKQARKATHAVAWLMATELRTVGVDFSFAPVLDLGRGICSVIGDRAFHQRPIIVAELAHSWLLGVHEAGMAAVGKHFPGHGGVQEDSHLALPVDNRRPEDIRMEDLLLFQRMIDYGMEAIMPAHVVYERACRQTAGFSDFWLKEVLRRELGFQGVIFSDDLTMAAANVGGDYPQRAQAALDAGCDMILVCNNREGAIQVLEALADHQDPASQMRLLRMHGRQSISRDQMHLDPRWRDAVDTIAAYDETLSLSLDLE